MNIPNLPSDSLYKFLAFFGLTIIIASLYIPIINLNNLQNKINSVEIESVVLIEEIKILISESDKLIKEYNGRIKEMTFTDSLKNGIVKMNDKEFQKYLDANIKKGDELRIKSEKNDKNSKEIQVKTVVKQTKQKQIDKLNKQFHDNIVLFISLSIIGALTALIGFTLWYNRSQRLADAILLNEYLSKEKISMVCQSCLKNLESYKNEYGLEQDGHKNKIFCINCYNGGSFTEPNMTLAQMQVKVKKDLIALGLTKSEIKNKLKTLEHLQRWKILY